MKKAGTYSEKNKSNSGSHDREKTILIGYALLLVIMACLFGYCLMQSERLRETQTQEYWAKLKTKDYIYTGLEGSVIEQRIRAAHNELEQIYLFFDHYSPEDTAVLLVTLRDDEGKEYYRYSCPTSAFGGESFCLVASLEEELSAGRYYTIRVELENPGSDITIRVVTRADVHRSVKELYLDGNQHENEALSMMQVYRTYIRYDHYCEAILIASFLIITLMLLVRNSMIAAIWELAEIPLLTVAAYYGLQLLDLGIDGVMQKYLWDNLLLLLGIFFFLKGLLPKISYYVSGILVLLIGIVNFYVCIFRGTELIPDDIRAFWTAVSVADNYHPEFSPKVFMVVVLIVALELCHLFASLCAKRKAAFRWKGLFEKLWDKLTGGRLRKTAYLLCRYGLFLLAGFLLIQYVYNRKESSSFQLYSMKTSFREMGYAYSTMCLIKFESVKKPADYSEKRIEAILDSAAEPNIRKGTTIPKNLIVIMNESLADFGHVGEIKTDRDYLPYLHSTKKNAVQGYVSVNTFGGGTCITEWEFLTGNSQRFLTGGSKAYYTMCESVEPGIVRTLKNQGYYPVAMHPFKPTNWNRDKVYPALGFEEFIDQSGYEGYDTLRGYVSDKGDYQKIIDYYEAFDRDSNLFIFNVTMQNHGGYGDNNGIIEKKVHVEDFEDTELAENYLTLIYESDQAIEMLFSYFEKVDEPTMILIFGDHFPTLPENFYKQLKRDDSSAEMSAKLCETPYILWTNYDAQIDEVPLLSANYLGSYVLQCAGLELTDYDRFLLSLMQEVPEIGIYGVKDSAGNLTKHKDLSDEVLADYKIMQYLRLRDRKSRLYHIFGTGEE